jgi:hypothetical protein
VFTRNGLDFRVAVLARVELEHEVDEPPRETGARAEEHGKARARHAGRAVEIDDAERRPELPVRLRLEVERGRIAMTTDFPVVLRT